MDSPIRNPLGVDWPDPFLLELGSGERPYHDGRYWVHNDEREDLPHVEIICKAEDITTVVGRDRVHELRAAHLLEHFSYLRTVGILKEWALCLVPGGLIHIEVPNLMWQCKALALDAPDPMGIYYSHKEVVSLIFGGQDYSGNYHFTGFTEETLKDSLLEAGYRFPEVTDIGQVLIAKAMK